MADQPDLDDLVPPWFRDSEQFSGCIATQAVVAVEYLNPEGEVRLCWAANHEGAVWTHHGMVLTIAADQNRMLSQPEGDGD